MRELLWETESESYPVQGRLCWIHAPKFQQAILSTVLSFGFTSKKLCWWASCQLYDECPISFFPGTAKLLEMIAEFPQDKGRYPLLFQSFSKKYTPPDHTPVCFCSQFICHFSHASLLILLIIFLPTLCPLPTLSSSNKLTPLASLGFFSLIHHHIE